MFDQAALQELLTFSGGDGAVLSLYLNADVGQMPMDAIKLKARSLLRDVDNGLSEDSRAIESYLDHTYDWSKPGLAIFSCADQDFFRAYPTAVSFRDRMRVGHKPYVKPLAHLLNHYAHYGVILVDRVGARFFHFNLGELVETAGALGEEIRKVKHGGGSTAPGNRSGNTGARREEEVADRNLRDMADEAAAFFETKDIRRIFIGGTAETVAQFREMLPKRLQSCVAGMFPMDKYAAEHDVRDRALELLAAANEKREKELVSSMIAATARGGNAVTGVDDTLQAVVEGRVQTLILSDGMRLPGYAQPESNYIVANLAKSPLSTQELTEVDDVIEEAVALTMSQGGHVEVISGNSDLEAVGRIGALLRF